MILVDANILIYAHVQSFALCESARDWLSCERAWIPQPTDRHVDFLDTLLALPGVHANLVPDAKGQGGLDRLYDFDQVASIRS